MLVSSTESLGAFNAGFDTVNLHRPTVAVHAAPAAHVVRQEDEQQEVREELPACTRRKRSGGEEWGGVRTRTKI